MKRSNILKGIIFIAVTIMLTAFILVPEEYPWYYEIIAFNFGLWPWLYAKKELQKTQNTSSE